MTARRTDAKVISLRSRLPRADPAEAAARNRALALLSGLEVDDPDGPLRLTVGVAAPAAGGWLRFETGVGAMGLAPARIAGQPVPPLPEAAAPDLPAALHQLSRLEPLIAAVERAVGLPLDPVGLGPPCGLTFSLVAADANDGTVHEARLCVDPACAAIWPDPPDRRPLGAAAAAPVALRALLEGPLAPTSELAELGAGDVVVLPRASASGWACALSSDRGPLGAGFLDLANRKLTLQTLETSPMLETAAQPAVTPDAEIAPAPPAEPMSFAPREARQPAEALALETLSVRLRVALNDVRLPLKALSGLRPGSVVTLPGDQEDLPVQLLADDQPIASGRLVSLGDAYGVLVDEVRAG